MQASNVMLSLPCDISTSLSVLATGTHGPIDVERRIEAFLTDFAGQLEAMSGEDFEGHRSALIASKLQKDRSLGEEADRHWEQIFNRRCCLCSSLRRVTTCAEASQI